QLYYLIYPLAYSLISINCHRLWQQLDDTPLLLAENTLRSSLQTISVLPRWIFCLLYKKVML
ncbi:MAG: hypothetical protein MUO77_14165, partial [Anaerolineales bacterium]|nr:hypothetical protein [Anaerolineales bacterium]